mmetsp:Transcript_943/g.2539  ORF Transcript_943/g.2539 Transcript_943/m.2539 type:complete len:148 (-) Transcript_943:89-532(-)
MAHRALPLAKLVPTVSNCFATVVSAQRTEAGASVQRPNRYARAAVQAPSLAELCFMVYAPHADVANEPGMATSRGLDLERRDSARHDDGPYGFGLGALASWTSALLPSVGPALGGGSDASPATSSLEVITGQRQSERLHADARPSVH